MLSIRHSGGSFDDLQLKVITKKKCNIWATISATITNNIFLCNSSLCKPFIMIAYINPRIPRMICVVTSIGRNRHDWRSLMSSCFGKGKQEHQECEQAL
jgi:hypothetical protein